MSAEALGWVYRHSPYNGTTFAVHLAIADTVNDQNGQRFWMSQGKTATKARTTRKSVNEALARLEADGYLERHGEGPNGTIAFVFLFPDADVVYDTREVSRAVTPPATSRDTASNATTQPLSPHDPQTQENPTEPNRERRTRRALPPEDFVANDTHRAIAEEHHLDLEAELEAWLDNCRANHRLYADHDAAFRTWLRRAVEYGRSQPAPATLEALATPIPLGDRRVWKCSAGNPECVDGFVVIDSTAHPCACRARGAA